MKHQVFGHAAVIGKTIEQIISPQTGPTLIVFTDGTFAQLSVRGGPNRDPDIVWTEPFDRRDFPAAKLIAAGVMTAEEIAAANAQAQGAREQVARETRRRAYDLLKQEFEPQVPPTPPAPPLEDNEDD